MKTGEACDQYLNLPSLIQPHNLDPEILNPIAETLETNGARMAHHLVAASCRLDLLHIASNEGNNVPNLSATVDYAREQVAKCGEQLADLSEAPNLFPRLYQVSIAASYLGFYKDPRTLPHGGWDVAGAQKDAYGTVQTTLVNPLLDSEPRPSMQHSDEKGIEEVLRGLVVMQTLHRLQATDLAAVFGVFPSNIREQVSPQAGHKHASFKLKVLLPDQTFYPIAHPSEPEDPQNPQAKRHPEVAQITGPLVKGHENYSVRALAKIMRKDVDGDRLDTFEAMLLNGVTAQVLEAMSVVEPVGQSIYPPEDSRAKFAECLKRWLFENLLQELRSEQDAA